MSFQAPNRATSVCSKDLRSLQLTRWALSAVFFINGMTIATWASRIPAIQLKLGLGPGTLGIALLSMAIGALISLTFAGAICTRFGSFRVISATLILTTISLVLPAYAPSLPLLALSIIMLGTASATLDVAMNAYAVTVQREYNRQIMSSFHALWSGGAIAGACAGSAMAYASIAPEAHFPLIALLLLLASFVCMRIFAHREETPAAESPATGSTKSNVWSSLVSLARSRYLLAAAVVMFCCFLIEGAVGDWSAVYLQETLHANPGFAVLGYAGFEGAMALGRLLGDAAIKRFGDASIVIAGSFFALAGLILVVATSMPPLALIGFCLIGLGVANIVPIAFSAAGNSNELASANAIAVVALLGYFGLLIGPALIGFAAELTTLRVALALLALLMLAMAAFAKGIEAANNKLQSGRQ